MMNEYLRNKRRPLVLLPAIVLTVVAMLAQSVAWATPNPQTTVPVPLPGQVLLDEHGAEPESLLSGTGDVRIDLPAGAVNNAQADWRTLRYTPEQVGWTPPSTAPYFVGHSFSLEVYTWGIAGGGGAPLTSYSFIQPIWVQINYTGGDVTSAAGRNLQVAYYDGTNWVLLANQTFGPTPHVKGQITTLATTAQTWFALVAPPQEQATATITASAADSQYGKVQVGIGAITKADGTTAYTLPGGVGLKSYAATAAYDSAGVQMKQALGGTAPFDTLTSSIGATQTTFSKSQTASAPLPQITLANLYPILVGGATTAYNIVISYTSVTDTANLPIGTTGTATSATVSFLRGDADKSGAVDIVDALFIAQYLADPVLRPITDLNAINAASVQHDDATNGDKITVVDALYIAQKQAGLRNADFTPAPGSGL